MISNYQNEVTEHRDAQYLPLNFRFMDNRSKSSEIIVNVVKWLGSHKFLRIYCLVFNIYLIISLYSLILMMAVFNNQHKVLDIFIISLGEPVWAPTYPWAHMSCFSCWLWARILEVKKKKKSECFWQKFKDLTICSICYAMGEYFYMLLVRVQNVLTSVKGYWQYIA